MLGTITFPESCERIVTSHQSAYPQLQPLNNHFHELRLGHLRDYAISQLFGRVPRGLKLAFRKFHDTIFECRGSVAQ